MFLKDVSEEDKEFYFRGLLVKCVTECIKDSVENYDYGRTETYVKFINEIAHKSMQLKREGVMNELLFKEHSTPKKDSELH